MVLGGQDQVVHNKYSKNFFDCTKVTDKDLVTYDDACHFLLMDKEYQSLIAKDLIGWFNTHI